MEGDPVHPVIPNTYRPGSFNGGGACVYSGAGLAIKAASCGADKHYLCEFLNGTLHLGSAGLCLGELCLCGP